ncbi:hypothetical protein BpHYR1_026093 [Brachionus plicatilis]|uniref:Insulin-like domain-containing protein n=1 Tax=Brachionus plicatilis TaxID=10195 RepID=A0A3M7T7F9_BRAPC|nr:hypothetical protein BpHYR1_026093 [Brachionus plicatilis]
MNRSFYLFMLLVVKLFQSMVANVVTSSSQAILSNEIIMPDTFRDVSLNVKKFNNLNQIKNKRSLENEYFYQNFFNTENVRSNKSGQYCGEALYYLVEYYCIYIKQTSVYIPETDLDLVSVIYKRELSKENVVDDSLGIVNECCYNECKPNQLDKYCY